MFCKMFICGLIFAFAFAFSFFFPFCFFNCFYKRHLFRWFGDLGVTRSFKHACYLLYIYICVGVYMYKSVYFDLCDLVSQPPL